MRWPAEKHDFGQELLCIKEDVMLRILLWAFLLWPVPFLIYLWLTDDDPNCGSEMGYRDENGICVYE